MIITTSLPVQSLFFKHWHTDDTEVGVIVAKARFACDENGRLRPVGSPPPLHVSDIFQGDPARGYLLHEQDIAPAKAATDLLIIGNARSPNAESITEWPISIVIDDKLSYGFHVRGPCHWERGFARWRLSPPTPISELPLNYSLSYGGMAPGNDPNLPDIYEFNPSGIGYVNAKRLAAKESFAAPQIGELAEFLAADVHAEMTLHGVGPVAKAWLPRRSNAGTFDDKWQQYRHPRMPHDYSLRFWNCAPYALQVDPFMRGNETIILKGFSHDPTPMQLRLPGAGLAADLSGDTHTTIQLTLDTVIADVSDHAPSQHTVDMVWRGIVRDPGSFTNARIGPMIIG